MAKAGRPLSGDKLMSSTDRARMTRRRNAAKNRAYEVFANVVLMEIEAAHVKSLEMKDSQARRTASRAFMNIGWLTDRLSDLDAAADFSVSMETVTYFQTNDLAVQVSPNFELRSKMFGWNRRWGNWAELYCQVVIRK